MQDLDKPQFSRLFLEMQSCFPGTPHDELRLAAYWNALKSHPLSAVSVAIVRASSDAVRVNPANPRLPAAMAIVEHAKAMEKSVHNPNWDTKAITGETQKLHGLSPDNPYEVLARKWESENLKGNPDCTGRVKELMAVMDGKPIARDMRGKPVLPFRDWQKAAAGDEE